MRASVKLARLPVASALVLALTVGFHGPAIADNDLDMCKNAKGDEAIAACTRVVQDSNQSKQNVVAAYQHRAYWWGRKGDHDRAIDDNSEAIRLEPNNAMAYLNRSAAWVGKRDLDRAIADLNIAIQLQPNLSQAYSQRGRAWMVKRTYDRAIADFDMLVRLKPKNWDGYLWRGHAWFAQGEFERAIADYDEVIRTGFRGGYLLRGQARFYSGSKAEAVADLTKSATSSSADSSDALWLAIVQHRLGGPARLSEMVEGRDLARWPGPAVRLFLGQASAADVLAAADGPDQNPLFSKHFRNCQANFFIGQFALLNGAKEEAARSFQTVVEKCPEYREATMARAELAALRVDTTAGPKDAQIGTPAAAAPTVAATASPPAFAQQRSSTLQPGWYFDDVNKNSLKSFVVDSVAACMNSCVADRACKAWGVLKVFCTHYSELPGEPKDGGDFWKTTMGAFVGVISGGAPASSQPDQPQSAPAPFTSASSQSAVGQSPVPEGFCPQLKKVVAALTKEKSGGLKGKRLSKTEWEARESLPGMQACKFEADTWEKTGGDSMMKALTSFTSYRCELLVEPRKVTWEDANKNLETFKKLNREAGAKARELATKAFDAFGGAIDACIPGMSAERSVGENGLFRGLPKVVFKKKQQSDIELWVVSGLKNLRVELQVIDHFFRGR